MKKEFQTSKPRNVIPRTMAGLRDALFETLEKLRDGDMVREDAREMANLSRVIIESVDVQICFETKKSADEIPANLSDMSVVPPLTVQAQHLLAEESQSGSDQK